MNIINFPCHMPPLINEEILRCSGVCMLTSSGRYERLQRVCADGFDGMQKVSYMHDNRSSNNVIHGPVIKHVLYVDVKVLLVGADGPHQLCDVVGVESAGLRGQTAGEVRKADVRHSL